MNQLTLRGLDTELEQQLRRLAENEHISLNKAALRLMRRGAGLEPRSQPTPNVIGHQLDDFIGSWDATQQAEFDAAVKVFETIDTEQWQ